MHHTTNKILYIDWNLKLTYVYESLESLHECRENYLKMVEKSLNGIVDTGYILI